MAISESIKYIGASTHDLDLFEGQYTVPNGMAYNSYLIDDEKIAIMDTVDKIVTSKWLDNLKNALAGKEPTYLIIQHLEPDHSANVNTVIEMYPNITLVCTAKAKSMLGQFGIKSENVLTVGEGDELSLGSHTLKFILAPMVHWPEVMLSYEISEKALFSADAFGKFGAIDADENWNCEARRYYFNIVGKYGLPVSNLLKKASTLEINTIYPLHGPVLTDTIPEVLNLYKITRQLPSTAVLHAGIARSPALAGKGHVVPSLFERLGEDPDILGKMTDVITRLAQLPRVASREQRRTRRRRFRIRSVTILEQHTPCGHTVENRRRDPLAAISPEMKPCGIVGDAEQNIRTAHRIILPVNRDQSAQCGGSPKYKITSHRSHIVYCKIPGGPERRRGVTNLHWQYNGCRTDRLSRSSPKWHLPTVRY